MKFHVTMAVEIQIQAFWTMTSCLHVSGYRRYRDTYCLHLHGRREPNMDVGKLQKIGLW